MTPFLPMKTTVHGSPQYLYSRGGVAAAKGMVKPW